MLRYPLQEAIDLLQGRLDAAKKSMEEIVEDLEFLQEQITVMDVNYARIHNVSLPSGSWSYADVAAVGCQAVRCGVDLLFLLMLTV